MFPAANHLQHKIPVSSKYKHNVTASCQCQRILVRQVWYLGICSSHGWDIYSAEAECATASKTSEWSEYARRRKIENAYLLGSLY